MLKSCTTLLVVAVAASFMWHVFAMIFLSTVVVVTVGDSGAGSRRIDFTEIDFSYELVDVTPAIITHFEPPVLPEVRVEENPSPLEETDGNRKLFDTGFTVAAKKEEPPSSVTIKKEAVNVGVITPKRSKKEASSSDVKVHSGVYDEKGKPVQRTVIFKPSIPNYPLWAEVQGREFRARFNLSVSPGGRVLRVRILSSSGSAEIDRISASYLRRWKFITLSSKAGIQKYTIPIGFVLQR